MLMIKAHIGVFAESLLCIVSSGVIFMASSGLIVFAERSRIFQCLCKVEISAEAAALVSVKGNGVSGVAAAASSGAACVGSGRTCHEQ